MRLNKIITTCIALSLMPCGANSAAALDAATKDHSHSHKGYYKPGAAVELTYDYDGHTQLGELENLTLTLQHYYSDGYISARLLDSSGLEIITSRSLENEKLKAGSNLQLPIQLSGMKSGEYYISLEIIYESLSGKRSLRVLSLPVQIGNVDKAKGANTFSQHAKSITEEGFIIFEAQEIIR